VRLARKTHLDAHSLLLRGDREGRLDGRLCSISTDGGGHRGPSEQHEMQSEGVSVCSEQVSAYWYNSEPVDKNLASRRTALQATIW